MRASFKERLVARLLWWGGTLFARAGHATFASQLFRTAESLNSDDIPPFDYAHILWQDSRYEEAKRSLTNILASTPEHAKANNLLGILLFEEDEMTLAGQHFKRAIEASPSFAAPHNNLGNIYRANGELEDAARCYRAALGCDPNYVEALTNLGVVLNLQGEKAEAEIYCRKAIELAPEFAGAHCNLGNILLSLGRGGEAVAAYRESLRLQPGLPEALVNLALVLEDSNFLVGTIDYYEKQLQRQPGNHMHHVRIAQALQALMLWEEARQRLWRALELKPDSAESLFVLGVNHIHVGDVRAAIDYMRRVLDCGANSDAQRAITFNSLYLEDCSAQQLCAENREWVERYLIRPRSVPVARDRARVDRRLRIGYVSRDFAKQSVAFFLEPILKHHDRSRFQVFCYSTLIRGDDFTERFRALADAWRDISTLPEKTVVELIMEDEIDILIDLSGHTLGNRLGVFACKPAPLQVTYLGYPTTTGLNAIDYRLGDAITDPIELTSGHYVESLWQLPGCFLTYQPPRDAPPVAPLPSLTKGYVTFGSFNNAAKINARVIAVWAEILAAAPSSRLLLKSYSFGSSHGRARVIEGFSRHGISPERLELVNWHADIQNHLEFYSEVDIALDPFPYNGTTTSCEALWMGVPVICVEGDRHSARVGASLLTITGLEKLLARDEADYVRIAVELAGDCDRMRTLRESMRYTLSASALLDHSGFTNRLEQAYRQMWRGYCQHSIGGDSGGAPEHSVSPQDEVFRLHIGGQQARAGWKVLNIQAGDTVDYLGDIRDLSQFEDQVCDEVYASHVLEHVAQEQVPLVLQGVFRILKPGGCLRLSVPDLEALCRLYIEHSGVPEVRLHVMRMMFGGQIDPHDYHQVGFDFEFLRAHLRRACFERIDRVKDFNIFDDTSGYAPYGVPISLNVIAYRPKR